MSCAVNGSSLVNEVGVVSQIVSAADFSVSSVDFWSGFLGQFSQGF
jgi:hypothetical protein